MSFTLSLKSNPVFLTRRKGVFIHESHREAGTAPRTFCSQKWNSWRARWNSSGTSPKPLSQDPTETGSKESGLAQRWAVLGAQEELGHELGRKIKAETCHKVIPVAVATFLSGLGPVPLLFHRALQLFLFWLQNVRGAVPAL